MDFYCTRTGLDVKREDCEEYCEEIEDCKKEGYLSKIDLEYGITHSTESERKRLQSLEKTVQRALEPNPPREVSEKVSKEELYLRKITGTVDRFHPPFKVKDFKEIVDSLGLKIDPEKLFKESTQYLVHKSIWKDNPSPSEIKSAATKIYNITKKLAETLEDLSANIYNALKSTSYDLDNLDLETHRVNNFILDEFGETERLGYFPQKLYINRLAQIYEDDTRHKVTVGYNPVTDKRSKFLQLVDKCLNLVD